MAYINNNVRKTLLFMLIAALLLLDFAALDDITTGKQESYLLEYVSLLFSIIVFGIIGAYYGKS